MEEELVDFGDEDLYTEATINPSGTVRKTYTPIDDDETLDILHMLERGIARHEPIDRIYRDIAKQCGRAPDTIKYHLDKLRSTKLLAKVKLEAGLGKMADRLIEKANTDQIIDIFSRPNIGILEPAKRNEGGTGFILSVQADTCGTVVRAGVVTTRDGGWNGPQEQLQSDAPIDIPSHAPTGERPAEARQIPSRWASTSDRQGEAGYERGEDGEPDGRREYRSRRSRAGGTQSEPYTEEPPHHESR